MLTHVNLCIEFDHSSLIRFLFLLIIKSLIMIL